MSSRGSWKYVSDSYIESNSWTKVGERAYTMRMPMLWIIYMAEDQSSAGIAAYTATSSMVAIVSRSGCHEQ